MITPDYVVEGLCQIMGDDEGSYGIEWREDSNGVGVVFVANVNGVDLRLFETHARQGVPRFLKLTQGAEEVIIGSGLSSEVDMGLARLYGHAARQCALRRKPENLEAISQRLFRAVVFGTT